MTQKATTNIALYVACILFLFLPFSSWLVSLTGNVWVSAVRDVLVAIIFVLALFNIKKFKLNFSIWAILVFLIYALLSFFWREASATQWLKGARFLLLPLILFLSLSVFSFNEKQKKTLFTVVILGSAVIILFAILEIFHIYITLTTSLSGVTGGINRGSMVGAINIERLQSVVDGPNAFGLYLLALFGYAIVFFKNKLVRGAAIVILAILLVLTFSRSALLGLIVLGVIYSIYLLVKSKLSRVWIYALPVIFVLLITFFGIAVYKNPSTRDFVSHHDSTSIRFEQYQRIWDSRYEIGLLGRGTGTAGPSSQNRIDGGPNHFTENIYFDIFEELGLIGLAIYLTLIVSLIVYAKRRIAKWEGLSAFLVLTSFAVTGLFINYYTGQIGIFLVWLTAAVFIQSKLKDNRENL